MRNIKVKSTFDKRIFTFYATLNATGYNAEQRNQMHPIRLKVRQILFKKNLDVNLLEKLLSRYPEEFYWRFRIWILCHDNPPNFNELSDFWKEKYNPDSLKGFKELMIRFFEEGEIEAIYQDCHKDYHKLVKECQELGEVAAQKITDYLRILEFFVDEFIIIPNLLDSYYRSLGPVIDKISYCIIGPREAKSDYLASIEHEMLHSVINPLTESFNAESRSKIREYLIHAICLRLNWDNKDFRDKKIQSLKGDGFQKIDFLIEKLKEFEKSKVSFSKFLPTILDNLD